MKGPEEYLVPLGITLQCAVNPEATAILDVEHRIFVNYETYYVSTLAAREAFLAAPYAYAGRVTDPVSSKRFVPSETSPRQDYGGRVFLFTGEESAAKFARAPGDYATPMITMVPMSE